MGITFRKLQELLPFVVRTKKPVMLRGPHGIGKSQGIVYGFAKDHGMEVVERRASQMTEGDVLGLPKEEGKVTINKVPDWLNEACEKPVVLFLDEVDRAVLEVRQALFELTDSRKIAGNVLHPDTLVFAAINGGEQVTNYQVADMDPAELDRWVVFDVEPDAKDWVQWGKKTGEVHPVILDFIHNFPNYLEHKLEFVSGKVYPSRRSWHRFSEACTNTDLIAKGEESENLFLLAQAYLGLEPAMAFCDYVKNSKKDIRAEVVLEEGNIEATKDFTPEEHLVMFDKLYDYVLDKDAKEEIGGKKRKWRQWTSNISKYTVTLPGELGLQLFKTVGCINKDFTIEWYRGEDRLTGNYMLKIFEENPEVHQAAEALDKKEEEENKEE